MGQIKDRAKEWKNKMKVLKDIMDDTWAFYRLTAKYNASVDTDKDIEKMQYTLLRENHTIEKGLSMRNPRKGFGQQKVLNILEHLNSYVTLYYKQDIEFLNYPLSTIKHYIEYTKAQGIDIPIIERHYEELLNRLPNKTFKELASGVVAETKNDILDKCNQGFSSLLCSRHSLRYFTDEIVHRDIIDKALELAQRTPSACNRQGWKSHVFNGDLCLDLLEWQGGCRGFEHEIHTAVVVTANLKAFLSYEIHQAYVDGGLYAMNLINAFHSLGIGTIPLSTAFHESKLKKLKEFCIPENEVPVVIIGCGYMVDKFNVAVSERKNINQTNTYHL